MWADCSRTAPPQQLLHFYTAVIRPVKGKRGGEVWEKRSEEREEKQEGRKGRAEDSPQEL